MRLLSAGPQVRILPGSLRRMYLAMAQRGVVPSCTRVVPGHVVGLMPEHVCGHYALSQQSLRGVGQLDVLVKA